MKARVCARLGLPEVEALLRRHLGVSTIIWLERGLEPDPLTDGHVDGICAFASPGVVLLHAVADSRSDPANRSICDGAKRLLRAAIDARGRCLEIIEMPLAAHGRALHMNFYLAQGAVITLVTGDVRVDDARLCILRDAFPGRIIVPVRVEALAAEGGTVHCITQQVQRGEPPRGRRGAPPRG